MDDFKNYLDSHPENPDFWDVSLHDISDPINGIRNGRVRTIWSSQHDSDSAKDWNPLYTLAGRPAKDFTGVEPKLNAMESKRIHKQTDD